MTRPQDGNGLSDTTIESDVKDDIAAALKEVEGSTGAESGKAGGEGDPQAAALRSTPAQEPAAQEPQPAQGGQPRGPDGKFAKATPDPAQPDAAAGTGQPQGAGPSPEGAQPAAAPAGEGPQPPAHWSQLERDRFAALPKEIQPILLEKVTNLERGYQEKFQTLAEAKRVHDEVGQIFAPLAGDLQRYRMTNVDAIKYLVATQQAMRRDPAGTLRALAKDYGIDLGTMAANPGAAAPAAGQPAGSEAFGYLDPRAEQDIAALRAQVTPLTQTVQTLTQAIQASANQQREAAFQNAVAAANEFANAKGPDGKALHPYYADVREAMAELWEKGVVKSLPEAYELACQRNPEVKAALQRQAEMSWAAKREAERKADLARAKPAIAAPAAVAGTTTRDKPASKRDSVKADLEEVWREAQARV